MDWKTEKRKIADLIPAAYNPRLMTEDQGRQLRASIDKFALCDPIIINTDNTIIGGHMRIRILKEKGIEEVDVRVPDRKLTAEEEKELNLRLNKNVGVWDFDLLKGFDENLLLDIGFSMDEIKVDLKEVSFLASNKTLNNLEGMELARIAFEIPVKFKDDLFGWLGCTNKNVTATELGRGLLDKCGLL